MRIDVFSLFPGLVGQFAEVTLLGRAQRNGLLDLRTHDLRDHAQDRHRTVDDTPFGGGPGMVLRADPIFSAVEAVKPLRPLLLLAAAGERFDQAKAAELAQGGGFSLICGRYEGVDQRVADHLCDGELSVGDVVLAGGEVAALVVIEAVTRLLTGVMGNDESSTSESYVEGLLEYPQYTRPAEFSGYGVPQVLQSGDHGAIERWRKAASLARTVRHRPDLIAARGGLSDADHDLLCMLESSVELDPGNDPIG